MLRHCVRFALVIAVCGVGLLETEAQACCRNRYYSTVVVAPAPVVYQAAPVYYQASYQPVQPAYYAAPTYYAPAVQPAAYYAAPAPYREHVRVHVNQPGPDYRYDYRRTGNHVRVRQSY